MPTYKRKYFDTVKALVKSYFNNELTSKTPIGRYMIRCIEDEIAATLEMEDGKERYTLIMDYINVKNPAVYTAQKYHVSERTAAYWFSDFIYRVGDNMGAWEECLPYEIPPAQPRTRRGRKKRKYNPFVKHPPQDVLGAQDKWTGQYI